MAATITLTFDDTSAPTFDQLIKRLQSSSMSASGMENALDGVAASVDAVNPELQKLADIHSELARQSDLARQAAEQTGSSLVNGTEAARNLGDAFKSAADGALTASEAAIKVRGAFGAGEKVAGTFSVAKKALGSASRYAAEGLILAKDAAIAVGSAYEKVHSQSKILTTAETVARKALSETAKALFGVADARDALDRGWSRGSAGGRSGGGLGQLASVALGAKIAIEGFNAVHERTGLIVEKVGNEFVFTAEASEDQVIAFQKMQDKAKDLGITMEKYVHINRLNWRDLGISVESNADRVGSAWKKLRDEVTEPLRTAAAATKEWWNSSSMLADAWKSFDDMWTEGAKNQVDNLGLLTKGWKELRIAIYDAATGKGEEYRRERDLMSEQAELSEKLADLNARTRDDYQRLRESQTVFEQQIENRKEIIRLQNLNISGLQEERRELEQRAGQLAQSDSLTEERQKEFEKQREWLYNREQELIERNAKVRNDALLKTYADQQRLAEEHEKKIRQANEQEYRDYLKSVEDKKRADEDASRERSRMIQEEFRETLQYRQRLREEEKRLAEEQKRNREAHVKELASQFSNGISLKDARGQSVDLERNALQQIGQLRQQAMQQFVSGDVKGYMQSHQNAIQIYQQTLSQMKQLKEKFNKEGNPLDQIKAQFGDKDVLNQVADTRFLQAGKGLMEKNRDAFDAFRKQKAGGELSGDEERLSRQFQRDADKLQRDIMRQVNRDARNGKIGDDESARALNTLASRTVDTAQKQGKLNNDQAEGFRKAIEANAELAANAEAKSKQIEEMDKKLDDVIQQIRDDTSRSIAKARRGAR